MAMTGAARGLGVEHVAHATLSPDNPEMIRVRFLAPPPEVDARVERARARAAASRGCVKVEGLNHVLLAA